MILDLILNDLGGGGRNTFRYLLRDYFGAEVLAGAVNGTSLDPGPGVRASTDASSIFSISGGVAIANGSPAAASNLLMPAQERIGGRAFRWDVTTRTTVGSSSCRFGWLGAGGNIQSLDAGIAYSNANTINVVETGTAVYTYTLGAGTHRFVSILRAQGSYLLARVPAVGDAGVEGTYALLWPGFLYTTASMTPGNFCASPTAVNVQYDNFEVFDLGGNYGKTFGLSTAWTQIPATGATLASVANTWIEIEWTVAAGETLDIQFRRVDDNNCWIFRGVQADGKVYLYEKSEGTETERGATGGTAQTLTAGTKYRFVVKADGTTIKTFVNTTAKPTYTSATFQQTATGAKATGFATGANFATTPVSITL